MLQGVDNETIKELLNNQETVQAVDFSDIKDNNPLTKNNIKPWHQLLARHQKDRNRIAHAGQPAEAGAGSV